MKPCAVGIGGAGGKILKPFLQSEDVNLVIHRFGEHIAFGDIKGIWLESAPQDVQKQSYYGDLTQGHYPSYLICHGKVEGDSATRTYLNEKYGLDLKADGFDRRAEYLKALFEIFDRDFDPELGTICSKEFGGQENPLAQYMYRNGIRPLTNIATSKSGERRIEDKTIKEERTDFGRITFIRRLAEKFGLPDGRNEKFSRLCDSILFISSLGGGTGTGFINPITSFARSEDPRFFILALGILTERGVDPRGTSEGQRLLGAVIAIYDLLTKKSGEGIDGLLLIENQILTERFNGDFPAMNGHIFRAMKPLLDQRDYPGDDMQDDAPALRRIFWERDIEEIQDRKHITGGIPSLPPLIIPCYYTQPDIAGDINSLVDGALGKDGKLFPCDPTKAERALVFTRGFFSKEEIAEAVAKKTSLTYIKKDGKIEGKIKIYRKLGDSKNEDILILLRNPYGGSKDDYKRPSTLEHRLHEIISHSIKYIETNQTNILDHQGYKEPIKRNLRDFFYGKGGLKEELCCSLHRLEEGEHQIFTRPLCIFNGRQMNPNMSDSCFSRPGMLSIDRNDLRELVKTELIEILRSEEYRSEIK